MNILKAIIAFIRSFMKQATIVQPPVIVVAPPIPIEVTPPIPVVVPKENRVVLFEKALSFIGTDASPSDVAPDEYGCAETVCDILSAAFPGDVGFPLTLSTTQLYRYLDSCDKYRKLGTMGKESSLPGDIVISPTGYGNGNLANGHVGIKGEGEKIMSNSSATGTFESNYTVESWRLRYIDKGGFPMVFFRRK